MRKLIFLSLLLPSFAIAQTSPNLVTNQVPSAVQWNSYFINKADATNGILTTPTLNGAIINNGSVIGSDVSSAKVTSSGITQTLSTWVTSGSLGNVSGSVVASATNGTLRTLSSRANDVANFNLLDYGAFCDGSTDDAAAINTAVSAARSNTAAPGGVQAVKILFPPGRTCLIKSSINLTGFTGSYQVFVDGAGAALLCETSGTPCIDALSSRFIHYEHLAIQGSSTLEPNIGLQIGRNSTNSADDNSSDRLVIRGNFTFAAFYNLASETGSWVRLIADNNDSGGYGVVQDGMNHWNASSAFVTISITQDSQQSFNENTFFSPIVQITGASTLSPWWFGNTSRHRIIGGYASTGAGYCATLFTGTGTGENDDLAFDNHCETTAITDTFLVTGTNTTPKFVGFLYRDQRNESSNSIFKTDTGITLATMQNGTIDVAVFSGNASLPIFASPSLWAFSGEVFVPAVANWTPPTGAGGMTGSIQIGTSEHRVYPGNSNIVGANGGTLGAGNNSAAAGMTIGNSNVAGQLGSVVMGFGGNDHGRVAMVYGGHPGQMVVQMLSAVTTSATPVRAVAQGGGSGNSANTINIPGNTVYALRVTVTARRTDVTGNAATWIYDGGLLYGGSSAATVSYTGTGAPSITQSLGTTTGWAIGLAADNSIGGLALSVTGATGQTINWTAKVETAEVS